MKLKFFVAVALLATLAGCASKKEKDDYVNTNQTAQQAYNEAKVVLDTGLYNRAIELLKKMESRYPFGPVARQVQLDLIYAYSMSGDAKKALAAMDRFIKLNPNHPDLDYVYYMRGLTNFKEDQNAFQEFFGVDRSDRDLANTRQAFDEFKILMTNYPNSRYAPAAKVQMVRIKDTLAQHALLIADYYTRRGAHLAAANRARFVVENYRDCPAVEKALQVMISSYNQLGLTKLRDDAKAVLVKNFPNSQVN